MQIVFDPIITHMSLNLHKDIHNIRIIYLKNVGTAKMPNKRKTFDAAHTEDETVCSFFRD